MSWKVMESDLQTENWMGRTIDLESLLSGGWVLEPYQDEENRIRATAPSGDERLVLVKVEDLQTSYIPTEDILDELLQNLNTLGHSPVVVGMDGSGRRFLAYGWTPGGDGWQINILLDDPYSEEFDYKPPAPQARCEECHSEGRLPVSMLNFPVRII